MACSAQQNGSSIATRPRRRRFLNIANTSSLSWTSAVSRRYALDQLRPPELSALDIFAVASPTFCEHSGGVLLNFFDALRTVSSRGFLVTRRVVDCESASLHGIVCFTSTVHGEHDGMMSRGKWIVIRHFLEHGKAIVCVGADVRLLQPVTSLLRLPSFNVSGNELDAVFEANAANSRRQAMHHSICNA